MQGNHIKKKDIDAMITDNMILATCRDAMQFASNLLERTEYGEKEQENVADYLWGNFSGQSWQVIKDRLPQNEEWWDIVEGNSTTLA
jgi:hypothetical protein